MNKTFKKVLGVGLVLILSATVAGVTTFHLLNKNGAASDNSANFSEVFKGADTTLAAYNAVDAQPVDLTGAAESSLHSVVHIKSTVRSKTKVVRSAPDIFDFFFGEGRVREREIQTDPAQGFGSGVIISTDGYIVTNNHVIDGADEISIQLNDNRKFIGRVIGKDPSTDLALLKIEAKDLPAIPIGDSDALKVGEWVLAVGNHFNLNSTVTAGIVSAKARTLGVYNQGIESFIQTDAAINKGNSGGALVNARGELVGINAVLTSPTGAYAGYGFAIPTSIMTKVVADLKVHGNVQRALLGITGGSIAEAKFYTEAEELADLGVDDGVYVASVLEGGAADEAGIKEKDVIVGVENVTVKSMANLQGELAKHRPGDKVKVRLIRNKKEMTVQVTLKNEQNTTKVIKHSGMEILGAEFKDLTQRDREQVNLPYGIQVSEIGKGKMADSGIRKGFIILKANGEAMRSVNDLERVFKDALKTPERVLFISGIYPSGKRAYYAVGLGND